MARILSDKEIQKLLENGNIENGDNNQIRSNSYVFRLGRQVRFFSTNERLEGDIGEILQINAGDSALVTSIETVDFSNARITNLYKDNQICVFLTPTTTLVREGMQLPSTKIDPGYFGTLNWTIRNSSVKTFEMEIGEPIFKATFFLLSESEELPDQVYGDKEEKDYYHGKTGLVESKRRLPVDKDKRKKICVSASGTEFDRLKQSGFPYSFIATQLQQVGQDLVMVTKDFARLDEKVERQNREMNQKVDSIKDLLEGLSETASSFNERIDNRVKNIVVYQLRDETLALFGIVSVFVAILTFLWKENLTTWISPISILVALICFGFRSILRRVRRKEE